MASSRSTGYQSDYVILQTNLTNDEILEVEILEDFRNLAIIDKETNSVSKTR